MREAPQSCRRRPKQPDVPIGERRSDRTQVASSGADAAPAVAGGM